MRDRVKQDYKIHKANVLSLTHPPAGSQKKYREIISCCNEKINPTHLETTEVKFSFVLKSKSIFFVVEAFLHPAHKAYVWMLPPKAPVLQAMSSGWLSGEAVEYVEAGTFWKVFRFVEFLQGDGDKGPNS